MPCYCGKQTMSFRCSRLGQSQRGAPAAAELSCGQVCGRRLGCGNHTCQDICHTGKCSPCQIREKARCYCGKEERELSCGEGQEKQCVVASVDGLEQWTGQFACEGICNRYGVLALTFIMSSLTTLQALRLWHSSLPETLPSSVCHPCDLSALTHCRNTLPVWETRARARIRLLLPSRHYPHSQRMHRPSPNVRVDLQEAA